MKKKVLCPNHNYEKILMAYEPDIKRFWIHCSDRKCSRWVQVDINELGGVNTKLMPQSYHFDFEKMPTLACEA